MDENIPTRGNGSAGRSDDSGRNKKSKKKNQIKTILISVIVIAVFALLSFIGISIYKSSTAANIDSGKYQAVFLTNGQVYFGKLKAANGDYMKLNDIFYLQTKEETSSENPLETTDSSDAKVELIKLGSEIHGPDDEMIISKDQILFFENLKKDSKVTASITDFNKNKKQ